MAEEKRKFLSISKSTWNGFAVKSPGSLASATYSPINYEVEKDKVITLNGDIKNYELKVTNVNDNSIDLEIDGLYLKQGEDLKQPGISLKDIGFKKFSMIPSEIVQIGTPTMDAGASWKITFINL